ncbi:hypothetical protein V8B55DRAFT_1492706 [Mucor lusitanicus]
MPIYKPPSLVRQNAFIVEDDQTETPLDRVCRICFNVATDGDDDLFQPCQCKSSMYSTLYAHQKCFSQWLKENGYPTHCIKCRSVYAKIPSRDISKSRRKYVLFIVISLIVLYSLYHLLSSCSTIETIPSTKLYADFGDNVYKNVPDVLVAPRISKSCVKSSFPMHCTISVMMISIVLFLFY